MSIWPEPDAPFPQLVPDLVGEELLVAIGLPALDRERHGGTHFLMTWCQDSLHSADVCAIRFFSGPESNNQVRDPVSQVGANFPIGFRGSSLQKQGPGEKRLNRPRPASAGMTESGAKRLETAVLILKSH